MITFLLEINKLRSTQTGHRILQKFTDIWASHFVFTLSNSVNLKLDLNVRTRHNVWTDGILRQWYCKKQTAAAAVSSQWVSHCWYTLWLTTASQLFWQMQWFLHPDMSRLAFTSVYPRLTSMQ